MRETNHLNVKYVTPPVLQKLIMLQGFMIKKKPFKCEICDYTFTQKAQAKKLVESFHEKKKPFKNVKFVDTAVL